MARLARAEVFSPNEVAVLHVMNRVVRRCFLLGNDPMTGKNYDHRKVWVETLLKRFAANFGIDLLGFAILSNHFHLILRQIGGNSRAGTLPILERLSLDPKVWCDLIAGFGRLFYKLAGQPHVIDATPSRVTAQRFRLRNEARKLFFSPSPESSA